MKIHRLIASSLGIGYIGKGGGTVAAAATCLIWYALHGTQEAQPEAQLLAILLITALGIWSAGKVERQWGKDDKKVVIDEVAGMCITLWMLPVNWLYIVAGLILFRFFDIAKPLYIRQTERLPGGWGVMLDDVVAGIYANCILQLILYFNV